MSDGNLRYWLLCKPRHGERFCYYTGNLMKDRQEHQWAELVDKVGKDAWAAYCEGKVLLFQQRMAPGVCAYIAVKI